MTNIETYTPTPCFFCSAPIVIYSANLGFFFKRLGYNFYNNTRHVCERGYQRKGKNAIETEIAYQRQYKQQG